MQIIEEMNLSLTILGACGLFLAVGGLLFQTISKRNKNLKSAKMLSTLNRSNSSRSEGSASFIERLSSTGAAKRTTEMTGIAEIAEIAGIIEKPSPALANDNRLNEMPTTPARNVIHTTSIATPMELLQGESEKVQELLSQVKSRVESISRIAQKAKANADDLTNKETELKAELELSMKIEREAKSKQEQISQNLARLQEEIKIAQQSSLNAQKELDSTMSTQAKALATLEVITSAKNEVLGNLERVKPTVAQLQLEAESAQRELKSFQDQLDNVKQLEMNAKMRTEEAERDLKNLQEAIAKERAEIKSKTDIEREVRKKIEELKPQLQALKSELATAEVAKKRADNELYLARLNAEKANVELSLIRSKDLQQNHDQTNLSKSSIAASIDSQLEPNPNLLIKDRISQLLQEGYNISEIAQLLNLGKGQVEFLVKLNALNLDDDGEKVR